MAPCCLAHVAAVCSCGVSPPGTWASLSHSTWLQTQTALVENDLIVLKHNQKNQNPSGRVAACQLQGLITCLHAAEEEEVIALFGQQS